MASLSKREQARNERELQDLLRQPGNSQCADCNARNPSWASWNLGIFLCMRCASIHRKLGTHISKVKSLSMDKWTTDQVESMKQHGNTASNRHYNPKNKKPDIPLDADEVDSAMERFIRKKYQEKSLESGRPEPPSRADVSPSLTQSAQPSPNPELPPTSKKHKFFGFSLRTSSKKDRAGVQDAFNVTPVEYSPTSGQVREVSDRELQEKLSQLHDMGFRDNERNSSILKRQGGDLERTIAMLVRLGPSEPSRQQSASPAPPRQQRAASATTSAPSSATVSNNPWAQLDRSQAQSQQSSGFGLSFDEPAQQPPQQPPPQPNANPWQAAMAPQQTTGLEQQFSGMQVSNPLFPHHTGGGYGQSSYQDPRQQTMTPPVPSIPQQYGYNASPTSNTSNPFYQQPLSSQSTGNNPFLQQQQSQPVFAPQMNPFMAMQQGQSQGNNPFGLPPAQQQQYMQNPQSQLQQQNMNPFGVPSQGPPSSIQQSQTFPVTQQQPSPHAQQQSQPQLQQQAQPSQPQISSFNYAQNQPQQQPQPQSQFQQPQQQQQQQAYYQNQQFQPQQPQPLPLQSQPTGRYTKTDIMALFNQPSSSQPPLPTLQEAYDDPASQQQQMQQGQHPQQQISPTPSSTNNPYGALGMNTAATQPGKRSATMPVMSSMHSSGGPGQQQGHGTSTMSRNPFLAQQPLSTSSPAPNPFGQAQQQQQQGFSQQQGLNVGAGAGGWTQGARHASNESVSVNNPALMDGRHSPDAFASLSSRY
ncbi:Protein gts1 [Knufia obscura]|uniref:Protein gts1 n=1 Tax=Knufia obscura TaxID=1635080 RepID=A0ABR0RS26_9EURO|nr:Protein gts1 [Knufia obscura]